MNMSDNNNMFTPAMCCMQIDVYIAYHKQPMLLMHLLIFIFKFTWNDDYFAPLSMEIPLKQVSKCIHFSQLSFGIKLFNRKYSS